MIPSRIQFCSHWSLVFTPRRNPTCKASEATQDFDISFDSPVQKFQKGHKDRYLSLAIAGLKKNWNIVKEARHYDRRTKMPCRSRPLSRNRSRAKGHQIFLGLDVPELPKLERKFPIFLVPFTCTCVRNYAGSERLKNWLLILFCEQKTNFLLLIAMTIAPYLI